MEPEARNRELEEAILADPDDRLAWRVYADWLMEQESMRGQLMASMAGFSRGERTDELMRTHWKQLLGPLAEPELAGWATCDWWPGFWHSLTLNPPRELCSLLPHALPRLLSHPSAALLVGLSIWLLDPQENAATMQALLAHPQRRVLRSLSWRCALAPSAWAPLLQASWPHLRSLTLVDTCVTDALVTALIESPVLPQLETLALPDGDMSARGAKLLLLHADRFRHLRRFDLRFNFTEEREADLRRVFPSILLESRLSPRAGRRGPA